MSLGSGRASGLAHSDGSVLNNIKKKMILQSLMLKTLYKEGSKEGESRKVCGGDEDREREL